MAISQESSQLCHEEDTVDEAEGKLCQMCLVSRYILRAVSCIRYNKPVFVSFLQRYKRKIHSRQTRSCCPWWDKANSQCWRTDSDWQVQHNEHI